MDASLFAEAEWSFIERPTIPKIDEAKRDSASR